MIPQLLTPRLLKSPKLALLASVIALTTTTSCSSNPIEPPTIDQYVNMVYGATSELLTKERADRGLDGGADTLWVAVMPIEYLGSIGAGNNDGENYGAISEAITDSKMFAPIARQMVTAGLNEARVGAAKNLYVPRHREAFLNALLGSAIEPDYFIFPELTTAETQKKGRVVERKTVIRLVLAHAHDGSLANESSKSTTQSE